MNYVTCKGLNILSTNSFSPVYYPRWKEIFNKRPANDKPTWLTNQVIGVHVWNKLSSKKRIYKNSTQYYTQLARAHCPQIFNVAPEFFQQCLLSVVLSPPFCIKIFHLSCYLYGSICILFGTTQKPFISAFTVKKDTKFSGVRTTTNSEPVEIIVRTPNKWHRFLKFDAFTLSSFELNLASYFRSFQTRHFRTTLVFRQMTLSHSLKNPLRGIELETSHKRS